MKTYGHLSRDERLLLFQWVREGCSQAEVARRLGRDKGTISRELRRNAVTPVGYLPDVAQGRYQARRQRCRPRLRLADRTLRRTVVLLLERGWSPEQIAGRLRAEEGRTVVNHETLYRFIYDSPLGRQEKLFEYLRRGKKKRSKRQGRHVQVRPISNRIFIDSRPWAANQRTEPGHWETDSLLYPHQQALNVLVDRHSRFTLLTKLAARSAQETSRALLLQLAEKPVRSLTSDNGSEYAEHERISHLLHIPFFFCHPYHSWEKGTVENTNGLIRRYLPHCTDLDRVTQLDLDAISSELNDRPRKCLDFLTPAEVLYGHTVALRS
ncbi:MAG: IS30 family transposase [Anaerolineales bacterium]|jgi:IS30 family transposase